MDFLINCGELETLCGLPHFHQLAYLRGIRPYMDVQTGIVGIKRGISYQSIAEQLYIEAHQGIKSSSFSRDQIKRALLALERAGLIQFQSEKLKLILKCPIATLGYFAQNKAALKPPQETTPFQLKQDFENKDFFDDVANKATTVKTAKAAPPLIKSNNNYIFLLKRFELFWSLYPLKNSEQKAWQVFQELNPSEELIAQILSALQNQLHFMQRQQALGKWVPNWKNPANWLAQRCWNDVLPTQQQPQDNDHAKNKFGSRKQHTTDSLWALCKPDSEEEENANNVIEFAKWGR